jgi:uncharacterized protein involved in response to NO
MGFRPFYLLASAFAAVSIGLWSLQFAGWLASPYLAGPMWHAHEMLFGFTLAVIVGFLFTAGANWSGRPVLTGKPLAALAMVWIAGRVLVLSPFGWLAAIVNAAFPLLAAVALAVPFIASKNRRNYFFIVLLCAMAAAQLAVHMVQLGAVRLPEWLGIQLALDLVLFIMAVMGGRVIPMFTNNGVPGAGARKHPVIEKASLGLVLTLVLVDTLQLQGAPLAATAFACAAFHFTRWALWRPWMTLRAPLVWILHAAYCWIPVHLALRGVAELGWIGTSAAAHALTVGAVGGLIIGMMTRTARGHTGRPLRASALDVACYLLITAAAVVRVGIPLVLPTMTVGAIIFSAVLWSCGFGLYAIGYWTALTRARIDGKAG